MAAGGPGRRRAGGVGAAAAGVLAAAAALQPAGAAAQQAASQHGGAAAAHSPAGHELYYGAVLFEQLEYGFALDGGRNLARWDGLAYYGTDYDRAFFRTQGETQRNGRLESAEFQFLYSRLLSYYWDAQAGVRFDPGLLGRPDRTYGVLSVQGLAPGLFEVLGQAFVSQTGQLSFRAEASYDLYITQYLVLQPDAEVNLAVRRDRGIESGAGLNNVEFGLRLRYEFTREVAPYIGVSYERTIGDTARFRRAEGERVEGWNFLTGVRIFF